MTISYGLSDGYYDRDGYKLATQAFVNSAVESAGTGANIKILTFSVSSNGNGNSSNCNSNNGTDGIPLGVSCIQISCVASGVTYGCAASYDATAGTITYSMRACNGGMCLYRAQSAYWPYVMVTAVMVNNGMSRLTI